MWGGGEVGHTENMNIQVPLLIIGITATTGAGVGTIAANTGGFTIDDLNALTSGVSTTVQTPVDIQVPVLVAPEVPEAPGAPAPTPTTPGDTATSGAETGSEDSASSSRGTSASNTTGTSTTTTTHGTSGGSASGGKIRVYIAK